MRKLFILSLLSILTYAATVGQLWKAEAESYRKSAERARYDSALFFAEEAAAISRGTDGENSLNYCSTLRINSEANFFLGKFGRARYLLAKEIGLREQLKKTEGKDYIASLLTAALISRKAGEYEEALVFIKKAEKKSEALSKSDLLLRADILYGFAGVYHDMGCSVNDMVYLNSELKYLNAAGDVLNQIAEANPDRIIQNRLDLAALYNNIGNAPQSEVLAQEAAETAGKYYGTASAGYASVLNNLGVIYYNTGLYRYAEKYLSEAAAVYRDLPVKDLSREAVCINNIGAYYYSIGNYTVSATLIAKAQNMFETASLSESPKYSIILSNMSAVKIANEYFASPDSKNKESLAEAGKTLLKADSVFRINCKRPHPYYQSILSNLGIWYSLNGDVKKSMAILNDMALESNMSFRVVALMPKIEFSSVLPYSEVRLSVPDVSIIQIAVDLLDQVSAANSKTTSGTSETDPLTTALLRLILGKAENLKKAVGIYHPAYAQVLKSLIVAYSSADDQKTEEEITLEYMNVLNSKIQRDFSYLSESEKEMYYQTRILDMNSFMAYFLSRKRTNPLITRYAYDNSLLNKGLMLKSSTAMRVAILGSNNNELLSKYDKWISLQKELSDLYSTPVEFRQRDIAIPEAEAGRLERDLVEASQEFSDFRKGVQLTWEDVRRSLRPDEAAIEFVDFRRSEKDGGNKVIYCALVLRHNADYPEMIKLFEEEQLSKILEESGKISIGNIASVYGTLVRQNDVLYNLIWKPLEQYLNGASTVYLSPTGLLNKISFPAISKGKGIYLCDEYRLQVKGSTGTIVNTANLQPEGIGSSALIYGGIEYSSSSSGNNVWSYLEGTKQEGDVVSSVLKKGNVQVNFVTGNDASETYFKENAGNFSILHMATHGFFFEDPAQIRYSENNNSSEYGEIEFRGSTRSYGVNSFVNSGNPLMRSGLVLAGANDVWSDAEKKGSDDGVLTAQEVTQIDMRKTGLAVLSACETGLGDIKGTEGVYGLQRSLKIAGVKNIIMSLWEIPDKETVEFMNYFYASLIERRNVRDAFYDAQRRMRNRYDPYYWAAFVLID